MALQSMSYFSICHRYSLLCYLTSCSVVCHLFCFCKIYTVFLFVTQCGYDVPALSSRYAAKALRFKTFCAALQCNKRQYISLYLGLLLSCTACDRAFVPLPKKDAYLNRLCNILHISAALILHSIRWDICPQVAGKKTYGSIYILEFITPQYT